MMKIKGQFRLLKSIYNLALFMAVISVNITCHCRFYQEKLDPQLDSLKKYHGN